MTDGQVLVFRIAVIVLCAKAGLFLQVTLYPEMSDLTIGVVYGLIFGVTLLSLWAVIVRRTE